MRDHILNSVSFSRAEVWIRLCNEEFRKLYASPNIIRVIGEARSMHVRDEKCIQHFGWKSWSKKIIRKT